MRKRAIAVLLAAALTTGCGAGEKKNEEPVKITVWTYYNGVQLTAFNELVEKFNETEGEEQGIRVESLSYGSNGDLETNVLNAAQNKVGADELPNIFAAYADTTYAVDQLGLVADLRPYFTDEELEAYVDSYIEEGQISDADSIKIFPVAKSIEVFMLNKTDWEPFAEATGATYDDFSTIEGVTRTAQAYYEWTDSLTPEPNDGKAFFGRDAMANYFLIGSVQQGAELFAVKDGKMTLNFDRDAVRCLWDNYYVPYIKGYFAASGRFRSDDVKTGNILAFVGSSSGSTFFPDKVSTSDSESHPIEMAAFPCPQFEDSQNYAVQQGAGMVVTAGEEEEVAASVAFLKWFTQNEQNIQFSVDSGYLPVQKSGNDMEAIRGAIPKLEPSMEEILAVAVDTVNESTLYTQKAFPGGRDARAVLEYAMSDQAKEDRRRVNRRLFAGKSLEEATEEFTSDAYFEAWYSGIKEVLEEYAG